MDVETVRRLLRIGVPLCAWFLAFAASTAPNLPASDPPANTVSHEELLRIAIADVCWPTDAGRVVTSTFGEFRSSHFHAGIDISTDVTGYRVFAARDGYVERISVAPHGYGKLLVLRHPDGYSTAYAHLSRFADAIAARVTRVQDSLHRYPVNILPDPSEFPVERGQLIAYTGDTGVGTPHLHFEVLDENGDPLNPLLCDDAESYDILPPVIYNIAIIPLGERSTVDGSWTPRVLRAGNPSENSEPLVLIQGRAGIAVEARDFANGTHFRRSTYRHTLKVDGRLLFATSLDRIDGKYPQQVGLHYDWPLLHDHLGRFERLFCKDSTLLPSVSEAGPEQGIIDTTSLSPGTHRFTVTSEDINGNRTEFSGFFHLASAAYQDTVPALPAVAGSGARVAILRHEFEEEYVRIILQTSIRPSRTPVAEIVEGPSRRIAVLDRVGPDRYAARIRPLTSYAGVRSVAAYLESSAGTWQVDDTFSVYPILPGTSGSYAFNDGNLVIEFDSLSVFAPLFLRVEPEGLDSLPCYFLEPQTVVLRNGLGIRMRIPTTSPSAGLYFRRTGGWSLVGRLSEPNVLTGRIRRALGDIAAREDRTPPTINGFVVRKVRNGLPDISFRYHDNLSGVDYDELKMYIDAKAVIPEVDGEHRRVTYRAPLPPGTHQVSIHLKDRLGNLRSEARRFVIR